MHIYPEFCILGIGVCYAMDDKKYKLGDVLISNQIHDFENFKYRADGEIEDQGQAIDIIPSLLKIFCKNTKALLVASEHYFATEGEKKESSVHSYRR